MEEKDVEEEKVTVEGRKRLDGTREEMKREDVREETVEENRG